MPVAARSGPLHYGFVMCPSRVADGRRVRAHRPPARPPLTGELDEHQQHLASDRRYIRVTEKLKAGGVRIYVQKLSALA